MNNTISFYHKIFASAGPYLNGSMDNSFLWMDLIPFTQGKIDPNMVSFSSFQSSAFPYYDKAEFLLSFKGSASYSSAASIMLYQQRPALIKLDSSYLIKS